MGNLTNLSQELIRHAILLVSENLSRIIRDGSYGYLCDSGPIDEMLPMIDFIGFSESVHIHDAGNGWVALSCVDKGVEKYFTVNATTCLISASANSIVEGGRFAFFLDAEKQRFYLYSEIGKYVTFVPVNVTDFDDSYVASATAILPDRMSELSIRAIFTQSGIRRA